MTDREANMVKKWLSCLGCGKRMWTDRCHRRCAACLKSSVPAPVAHPISPEALAAIQAEEAKPHV